MLLLLFFISVFYWFLHFGTDPSFTTNVLLGEPPFRGLLYHWFYETTNTHEFVSLTQNNFVMLVSHHLVIGTAGVPVTAGMLIRSSP